MSEKNKVLQWFDTLSKEEQLKLISNAQAVNADAERRIANILISGSNQKGQHTVIVKQFTANN